MDRSASKLTGTGVDFVVATTQASINSSLLEYLAEGTQPVMYLCFLAGQQGSPTVQVTLEELMAKTEGINPFDIPQDLDYMDPRLRPVTKARFVAGIKLQMGLPPGANPKDLSVVNFEGTSPNKVTFTMYCAQATVIHNNRGGFDDPTWNVWSQTAEEPWIARAEVDLVVADLDSNLENSPYLRGRDEVKEQLRKALEKFKFTGIDPTSDAGYLVDRYFVGMYQQSAREHGLPLLAITAVSHDPDPSSLQMTSFERTLTHPIGRSGPATTLNYLCAINNHPRPSPSTTFGWNWVDPAGIDESSGVIAIQRNAFIKFLEDSVQKQADSLCYRPWVDTGSIDLLRPTASMQQSKYTTADAFFDMGYKAEDNGKFEPYRNGFKCQVSLEVQATVKITFEGRHIKVVQWLRVYMDCAHTIGHEQSDGSWVDVPDPAASTHFNAVYKTLTSLYSLAVDERGALQLVREGDNQVDDQSDEVPPWTSDPNWQVNYDTMRKLQEQVVFNGVDLHELKLGNMHSFVFPGARVFTYKNPVFSKAGDLLCEIVYLEPTEVSSNPPPQSEPQPEPQESSPSLPLIPHSGRLTVSTELMQNYVHGTIVSPTGKFEALQTGDGHALLFAIDSSGVFHVIEEQSGTSHTGWHVHDLSTEAIQVQFPGDASRAVVRTFDVGQSVEDGTIGLMMAVHLDGNDHLFFSLGNPDQDLSWTTRPIWTMASFDPVNEIPQKITIAGAMFAETQEKESQQKKIRKQYLVVDINRLSESRTESEPHIARYHIDSKRTAGHYWVKHDVTIDLAAGSYQSVVGRVHNKTVDGIYTAGTAGGQPQLIYEPIINEFGSGPVNPRRLRLPGGAIPSAIATARHPEDGSTDLYSIGGSTLYRFASDQQSEAIEPLVLCTSDFLAGTDTLRAMTSHDGVTTLWGRNQSDQVYYLSCPTSQLSDPAAWSAPFPILSGIERISAYVNCADGGNTIFAAGDGKLEKIVQGSAATDKVWRAQEITLAAAPEEPCTSFLSYTTTIHVTQLTSNAPIPKAVVELSANSRTPVYINGVYYVLSTKTPLRVPADQTGTLTVIEATDSLQATVLTVSLENTTVTINPMDHSMDRIAALDSADKLRSAQVPRHTIAGGIDNSTRFIPLLDPSTHDDDVEAMAQSLGLLKEAYAKIQGPEKTLCQAHGAGVLATAPLLRATATKTSNLSFLGDLWHGAGVIIGDIGQIINSIGGTILSWGGDALQWLKNTAMAGLRLVQDTVTGGLHLLGNWAGKAWHVALNTWNTVLGFAEWLWNEGKQFARKAVDWATVLLHWGDIRRTKQVTHNLIRLWMQHQVDEIPHVAAGWNRAITGLEQTINQWAGTTDFAPLGADGEVLKKSAAQGAANPTEGQTSASQLLVSHYRNHAHQLKVVGDSSALSGVEELLFDLLDAVSKEGAVLGAVFDQLQQLVRDFSSLSLEDVLKHMLGILADSVLSSVQVVVDTLLQVLHTLTQSALAVLDTKIHIPIISDLLNTVGIPDLSFLDLFTWIIAVAFTIVYKITHNTHAPFPDNSSVSALIAANTWEEMSNLFGKSTGSFASFALAPTYSSKLATEDEPSSEWSRMLFAPGHFLAGLAGFVLGSVTVFEAESETEENAFATPAMILGIISAGMQGITNHFAPRDEIENKVVEGCEYALITIEVLVKVFFSGTAQGGLTKLSNKSASVGKLVASDARGLEAIVDAVLILPGIAIMGWHIYELSEKPAGKVKSAAILEECGKVSVWIARVAYAVAVNDPEPDSKEIAAGVSGLAIWAAAGFQIGEAEWC